MGSAEEHEFFEGVEVNKAQQQVHYLFIDLVFALFDLGEEFF